MYLLYQSCSPKLNIVSSLYRLRKLYIVHSDFFYYDECYLLGNPEYEAHIMVFLNADFELILGMSISELTLTEMGIHQQFLLELIWK